MSRALLQRNGAECLGVKGDVTASCVDERDQERMLVDVFMEELDYHVCEETAAYEVRVLRGTRSTYLHTFR